MSSMSVWVLPVPGGPWMSAISGEAMANLMASTVVVSSDTQPFCHVSYLAVSRSGCL